MEISRSHNGNWDHINISIIELEAFYYVRVYFFDVWKELHHQTNLDYKKEKRHSQKNNDS